MHLGRSGTKRNVCILVRVARRKTWPVGPEVFCCVLLRFVLNYGYSKTNFYGEEVDTSLNVNTCMILVACSIVRTDRANPSPQVLPCNPHSELHQLRNAFG